MYWQNPWSSKKQFLYTIRKDKENWHRENQNGGLREDKKRDNAKIFFTHRCKGRENFSGIKYTSRFDLTTDTKGGNVFTVKHIND